MGPERASQGRVPDRHAPLVDGLALVKDPVALQGAGHPCRPPPGRFATGLAAAGHTVLNEVVLNQVLVSFGDAGRTQRIIAAVQAEGTCWCSGTVWQGPSAMRISVSSWATTEEDVERSLAAILRIAAVTS